LDKRHAYRGSKNAIAIKNSIPVATRAAIAPAVILALSRVLVVFMAPSLARREAGAKEPADVVGPIPADFDHAACILPLRRKIVSPV
jgi:hypothetical protein